MWKTVRFGDGKYGVFKRHEGQIIYSAHHKRHEFQTLNEAEDWAVKLNGGDPPLRRCSPAEFERVTEHVPVGLPMRGALRSILVDGSTWKGASVTHGVTESGILRAMRRVAASNHP